MLNVVAPIMEMCLKVAQQAWVRSVNKDNKMRRYGQEQYKMRWILKFSCVHHLMNKVDINKIWLIQA
jgi:hypothetical protein